MDEVTKKFVEQWGIPGAIIVTMAFAIKILWDRVNKLQDDRLDEAKEYAKDISEIASNLKSTLDSLTQAINSLMARK